MLLSNKEKKKMMKGGGEKEIKIKRTKADTNKGHKVTDKIKRKFEIM